MAENNAANDDEMVMDFESLDSGDDPDYNPENDKHENKTNIPDYFNIRNQKGLLTESADNEGELSEDEAVKSQESRASSSVSSSSSLNAHSVANSTDKFSCITNKYSYLDGTYFKILDIKNKNIKTQCQLCLPKRHIINGIVSVSTNFLKHVQRMHSSSIKQYQQHILDNKIKTGKITSESSNKSRQQMPNKRLIQESVPATLSKMPFVSKEEFDTRILKFLVTSMSPLNILDNKYFINIFNGLNVSVLSKKMAVKKIEELNQKTLQSIKNELSEVEFVCTTTDIWSSKKRSFLGVTCHWLDTNLCRHSVALACKRFSGAHTYDRIAEILDEINTKFGLTNSKIIATVTDNGSNFVKCFQEFGVTFCPDSNNSDGEKADGILLNSENEEHTSGTDKEELTDHEDENKEEEEEIPIFVELVKENTHLELPNHKRCASHTLNLLATTDVNKAIQKNTLARSRHTTILNKCSTLWKKCSYPKSAEITKNCLGQYLRQPGATRWNSMFDCITHILRHKEKLNDLCQRLEIKINFREGEIRYLQNYCQILEPLASTLDVLQGEKNCYYGYLLPCLVSLKVKLGKLQRNENFKSEPAATILNACINGLNQRFSSFFELTKDADDAILATFSIPHFKLRWFEGIKSVAKRDLETIKKIIVTTAAAMVNIEENISIEKDEFSTIDKFFEFDFEESTSFSQQRSQNQQQSHSTAMLNMDVINLEILRYLEDQRNDLNSLNNYPTIKKLFLKFNTPLPSSAPVERIFSFATIINAPKRHALSDKNFENLVLLKANGNLFN